jgi:hypothetical protein
VPPTAPPRHNVRERKQPEGYIPSMKGNKYAVALIQVAALLGGSKNAMSMAQDFSETDVQGCTPQS